MAPHRIRIVLIRCLRLFAYAFAGHAAAAGPVEAKPEPLPAIEQRPIDQLDDIRTALLRKLERDAGDERKGSLRMAQLPWMNWPNLPSWNNFRNFPNWGNIWRNQ